MRLDDIHEELLRVVSRVGAQVDVPIESERFFQALASGFQGTPAEFVAFVRANLESWFRSLPSAGPNWIQEAEWQFHKDKPMMFAGEISVPKSSGLYHDDACVYVFISGDGVTKCVIQVM